MKRYDDFTDWLEPNNLGVAFAFFMRALPIRLQKYGIFCIVQLAIDSVWH